MTLHTNEMLIQYLKDSSTFNYPFPALEVKVSVKSHVGFSLLHFPVGSVRGCLCVRKGPQEELCVFSCDRALCTFPGQILWRKSLSWEKREPWGWTACLSAQSLLSSLLCKGCQCWAERETCFSPVSLVWSMAAAHCGHRGQIGFLKS